MIHVSFFADSKIKFICYSITCKENMISQLNCDANLKTICYLFLNKAICQNGKNTYLKIRKIVKCKQIGHNRLVNEKSSPNR